MNAKTNAEIVRLAQSASAKASEVMAAAGKSIHAARSTGDASEVLQAAHRPLQAMGEAAQVVCASRPEFLSTVGPKLEALRADAPGALWDTSKLVRETVLNGNISKALGAVRQHITEHPRTSALQVAGGVVTVGAIVAVPVLGAVGFAAAGPVAGSAAAAWQASLGLVQAGSVFAWCQSAAMGGAAVGGIVAAGVTGAGVTGAATAGHVFGIKDRVWALWGKDVKAGEGSETGVPDHISEGERTLESEAPADISETVKVDRSITSDNISKDRKMLEERSEISDLLPAKL